MLLVKSKATTLVEGGHTFKVGVYCVRRRRLPDQAQVLGCLGPVYFVSRIKTIYHSSLQIKVG